MRYQAVAVGPCHIDFLLWFIIIFKKNHFVWLYEEIGFGEGVILLYHFCLWRSGWFLSRGRDRRLTAWAPRAGLVVRDNGLRALLLNHDRDEQRDEPALSVIWLLTRTPFHYIKNIVARIRFFNACNWSKARDEVPASGCGSACTSAVFPLRAKVPAAAANCKCSHGGGQNPRGGGASKAAPAFTQASQRTPAWPAPPTARGRHRLGMWKYLHSNSRLK